MMVDDEWIYGMALLNAMHSHVAASKKVIITLLMLINKLLLLNNNCIVLGNLFHRTLYNIIACFFFGCNTFLWQTLKKKKIYLINK